MVNLILLATQTDTGINQVYIPMEIAPAYGVIEYSMADYLFAPVLFFIIVVIGYIHKKKKLETNPAYEYYLTGLIAKMICAIIFLLIFTEYYGYGDTCDYLTGSFSFSRLIFKNISDFFSILFDQSDSDSGWYFFDNSTGFPPHFMWKDPNTRFVMAISSIFSTFGLRSLVPTTILVSAFSYLGVWKLYLFFTDYYPGLRKQMAIAILFFPSLLFWGSGVMKDTYTFAAAGWLVYNIYMVFFKKQRILLNILLSLLNIFIIISIKPYIFMALFPGILIWAMFERIKRIKNRVFQKITIPLMIVAGFGITMVVFSSLSETMGAYGSMESSIKKAQIIQEDLLRAEQYGTNNYNIGTIDGTTMGMVKVAPQAIIAGMYRPFLWEARNPVMLISGLENTFLLVLTLYLLFKLKVIGFFRYIFSDPILLFSILFTVFFMFAVGLASANFGALVRYRIPALPFFVASVFIMLDKYKKNKEEGG